MYWKGSNIRNNSYGAKIDDHTGTFYLKFNTYQGTQTLCTGALEFGTDPENVLLHWTIWNNVPQSFPMVNHPKNEDAYLGFSELYQRTCYSFDALITYRVLIQC